MEESLRKPVRYVGTLEKFEGSTFQAHAYVRVGETLHHVPMNSRGILQPDGNITLCANGDRYHKIEAGAEVVIDLMRGADGKFSPGLWAPKKRPQR